MIPTWFSQGYPRECQRVRGIKTLFGYISPLIPSVKPYYGSFLKGLKVVQFRGRRRDRLGGPKQKGTGIPKGESTMPFKLLLAAAEGGANRDGRGD
jgi:hypothetical protein